MARRGQYWENYPNPPDTIVTSLKTKNGDAIRRFQEHQGEKKISIKYYINNKEVCCTYFRLFYGIDTHVQKKIARTVLGNNVTHRVDNKKKKLMKYNPNTTKLMMCDNFWADFFSTC